MTRRHIIEELGADAAAVAPSSFAVVARIRPGITAAELE